MVGNGYSGNVRAVNADICTKLRRLYKIDIFHEREKNTIISQNNNCIVHGNMANMRLKKMILQAVDNQLQANDPPITKVTYERLQSSGYTKQQAKEKIASILVEEMYDVLKNQEHFNEERYTKNLESLK